jgi:hypothetical protein
MKPTFTMEYWEGKRDEMLAKKYDKYYMDLEHDLDYIVGAVKDIVPEDVYMKMRKAYAPQVSTKGEELCRKMMRIVKDYKAGRCCFGYTTQRQEIEAWYEFQQRFEFNCYQLSAFRKKYNVAGAVE